MIGHDTYPPVPSFVLIFSMARLARTVVAGLPHHVTQRRNRREAIFFEDGDQEVWSNVRAHLAGAEH
jgi:hypothetical protein